MRAWSIVQMPFVMLATHEAATALIEGLAASDPGVNRLRTRIALSHIWGIDSLAAVISAVLFGRPETSEVSRKNKMAATRWRLLRAATVS